MNDFLEELVTGKILDRMFVYIWIAYLIENFRLLIIYILSSIHSIERDIVDILSARDEKYEEQVLPLHQEINRMATIKSRFDNSNDPEKKQRDSIDQIIGVLEEKVENALKSRLYTNYQDQLDEKSRESNILFKKLEPLHKKLLDLWVDAKILRA